MREAAAASASVAPRAPRDFPEAYRVLHVKGYVADAGALQQLLEDSLGVLEAADLKFMDAAAIEAIAALLKPGGVGKFKEAMGVL